ncbi:hypothetical protein AGMMS49940_00620 [Spirochaetia bacterium]|nr:hypothetical protein AGMMS49940_00620 [Spirochaetia bacterium]
MPASSIRDKMAFTTPKIIKALTLFNHHFPRQALAEAIEQRDAVIPYLLDALDHAYDHAEQLMEEDLSYELHLYAMYLLAQFREQRAFPKLIRILTLDEKQVDGILGDTLTDGYASILCSTYNGELSLLKGVIENQNLDQFIRGAALRAYEYIVRDGHITREDMTSYLHSLIRNCLEHEETEYALAGSIASVVLDMHIFELIPEVETLFDHDMIEPFLMGGYDSFINHMFDPRHDDRRNIHIDDTIGDLEHWACFEEPKPKPIQKSKPPAVSSPVNKKKIGRNDPCPCGSGKKYKHCCLNKTVNPWKMGVSGEAIKDTERQTTTNDESIDWKEFFKQGDEPYDLLTDYPLIEEDAEPGAITFDRYFKAQGIEIDIPVYKALYHRAIPLWYRRDEVQEDLGRIDFLIEAFDMFTRVCDAENIPSFAAFDAQYQVHYHSKNWITALKNLLETYKDDLPAERYAYIDQAADRLAKM